MNQLAVLSIILSCIGLAVCQTDLTGVLRCVASVADVQCTSGLNMGVANTFAQCGRNDLANVTASQCASNDMGELCAAKVAGSIDVLSSALASCLSEIAPGSTTCSSGCSTALDTLRNDLGCCINIFNVTVEGGPSLSIALGAVTPFFRYSLWERCAVATVGECPNAPSFTPGNRVSPSPCNDRDAVQAATEYFCTQTNSQPVLDALSANSDCQLYTPSVVNICGRQSFASDFCPADVFVKPVMDLYATVITECNRSIALEACPGTACTDAIEAFRSDLRCCVNNIYNSSLFAVIGGSLPTSIELWNRCGVVSPGFCGSTIEAGGSASTDKAFGVMLIVLAAAVIKFIF